MSEIKCIITDKQEIDPTVPSWAKAATKPTYTASEVGAVPTTRKINNKALSADITLSAADVGAATTNHGTHVSYSTTTPKAPGTATVGTETGLSRGDHVHPAQTSVSGNAGTATKLATARTIQTNLASTSSSSFNGTANITPGVTGILAIANGGTGNNSGNAASATKLQTARTIQVNLASTSSASFNGTANITPGVTGILPVANGGIGTNSLNGLREQLFGYSGWGEENAVGDATWWMNLRSWILTADNIDLQLCVGKTKKVTLTTAVLGTTTHFVRCIGANQDGDHTLTFQTANCLAQSTTWSSNTISSSDTTSAKWTDSNCLARKYCTAYYTAFPGRSYIKTISKGTCTNTSDSSRNGTPAYQNETVFLPSEREMGLDFYSPLSVANSTFSKAECTQGKNLSYSYYTSNASRVKKLGDSGGKISYWERSRYYSSNTSFYVCEVSSNGSESIAYYSDTYGVAPAYVIG